MYDGWNCVATVDSSNNLVQSYLWGSDLSGGLTGAGGVGGLLALTDHSGGTNAGTYVPHYDGNGNVTGLISGANGTVIAKFVYGPFGEVVKATGSMAGASPFQYSTKYMDAETGLNYYGYRYYNPSTGRWLSRDPVGEQGGVNLFEFAANDSINKCDQLGQFTSVQGIPVVGTGTALSEVLGATGVGAVIGAGILVAEQSYNADVESEAAMVRAEIDKDQAIKQRRRCKRCKFQWKDAQLGGDPAHDAVATSLNGGIPGEMVITTPALAGDLEARQTHAAQFQHHGHLGIGGLTRAVGRPRFRCGTVAGG